MAGGPLEALGSAYREHRRLALAILLGLPPVVLVLGLLVAPDLFYDRFLWKHIVGPVVADAQNDPGSLPTHGGVVAEEGYTLVSEAVYGILLVVLLYGVYTQLLRRYEIETTGRFLLALLPLILLGPLSRALEDALAFMGPGGEPSPVAYAFISPWIYFHVAFYAISFLLLGVAVTRWSEARGFDPDAPILSEAWLAALAPVAAGLALIVTAYAGLAYLLADTLNAVAHPVWILAGAAAALAIYVEGLRRWGPSEHLVAFTLSLPLPIPPLVLVARWVGGDPWVAFQGALFPEVLWGALALTLVVVGLVYAAARFLGDDAPALASFGTGFNLSLVFAHMFDGWSTYLAISDPFGWGIAGYGEKHPVSDFFLGFADGLGFPIVKFLMIALVIYLLDAEEYEDEAEENLVGLVKFAIFILGFAPGLRDVTRVMMGT
jgi:uncharacterized membrane protein